MHHNPRYMVILFLLTLPFVTPSLSSQFNAKDDIEEISRNIGSPCNLLIVLDNFIEALNFSAISSKITVAIVKSWTLGGFRKGFAFFKQPIRKVKPSGHICTFAVTYIDTPIEEGMDGYTHANNLVRDAIRASNWNLLIEETEGARLYFVRHNYYFVWCKSGNVISRSQNIDI